MHSRTVLLLVALTVLLLATATMGNGSHRMNVHKGMKRSVRNERTQTPESGPSPSSTESDVTSTAEPSQSNGSHSSSSKWWWPAPLRNEHTGEGTYYEPGLGSCGKTSGASDMIVAISHSMYDKKANYGNPNKNPYCGRRIKASYEGKSVEVTVVDRCTGCQFGDLDFSPAAFKKLASTDNGRLKHVKWSFQ